MTPDAVVQVTPEYGLIAEMKKNFSTPRAPKVFEQIAKYDVDLLGWWTDDTRISGHDLVLLTHVASSVRARDAFKAWQAEGNGYARPFSIVEFSDMVTGRLWMLLRRVEGRLSDPEHDELLRQGKKISDSHLLELFSKWKFSEQEPPLMHMLLLLHDYVLPLFRQEVEFDKETGRFPAIDVSCEELREKLSEQFCPLREDERYFQLPKLAWVRSTVDQLVRLGLATHLPGSARDATGGGAGESRAAGKDRQGMAEERYRISLRKPRQKDTIEYFTDKLLQADWAAAAKVASDHPSLFDPPLETRS